MAQTFRSRATCSGTFRLLDDGHLICQVPPFLRDTTFRALRLIADRHDVRHRVDSPYDSTFDTNDPDPANFNRIPVIPYAIASFLIKSMRDGRCDVEWPS